jgi:NitT/TauT family transport system ATP-binding protein
MAGAIYAESVSGPSHPASAIDALVRIDDVSHVFRQRRQTVRALSGITLGVREREFVAIVGASGCGKSTLLNIIAGLLTPTSGIVHRQAAVDRAGGVGMVFQNPVLLPWRTVLANVLLPIELLHQNGAHDRARELLKEVGLGEFEQALPHQLSGGMQQRVSICRALLTDPPLLLMDEPFGALDAITRERLNVQLQTIWSEHGKTIVLVTHNIEEAVFLADRIVVMTPRPGRVAEIITNELDRPRGVATYRDSRFAELTTHIREMIVGVGAAA